MRPFDWYFKRRLRKKLPYYKLTSGGKAKIDEMLMNLPRRGAPEAVPPLIEAEPEKAAPAPAPKHGRHAKAAPRHQKPEEPKRLPEIPLWKRRLGTAVRATVCTAVCAAFVCLFVFLILLRSSVPLEPSNSESVPGPTASPTPAPAYTMEIVDAETRGGYAFFDVILTALAPELQNAAFLTPELYEQEGNTELTIGGASVPLYTDPVFYPENDGGGTYRASVCARADAFDPLTEYAASFTLSKLYGMKVGGNTYMAMTEPEIEVKFTAASEFKLAPARLWSDVVGAANGVDLLSIDYNAEEGSVYAEVACPYHEMFQPSLSLCNPDVEYYGANSMDTAVDEDGVLTVSCTFQNVSPDAEQLVLQVFLPNLEFDPNRIATSQYAVAEFTFFPREGWFMRSETLGDCRDIEEVTTSWRIAAPVFTNHVLFDGTFVMHDYAMDVEAQEFSVPELQFVVYTDVSWALPLECEVTATNGTSFTVPLYSTYSLQNSGRLSGDGYTVDVGESDMYSLRPYRSYVVTVTFPKEDLKRFWKENDVDIFVKNTVSGKTLFHHTVPATLDSPPSEESTGEEPLPAPSEPPEAEPPSEAELPPESDPSQEQNSSQPSVESQPTVESEQPTAPTPAPTPQTGGDSAVVSTPAAGGPEA